MRHLGSVGLALLAAPLALLLAGRGLTGLADAAELAQEGERTDYFGIVASACAIGLAGLLYSLLTMARLAPLGPTLAGLGYLAVGIWALQSPAGFLTVTRGDLGGDLVGLTGEQLVTAATIAPLLAVPLLVTFCMPQRWRRRERLAHSPDRVTQTLDDLPPVPASAPAARFEDPDATPHLGWNRPAAG